MIRELTVVRRRVCRVGGSGDPLGPNIRAGDQSGVITRGLGHARDSHVVGASLIEGSKGGTWFPTPALKKAKRY